MCTLSLSPSILERSPDGLFCPPGGFHVDPWRPVERAITTHGHADHARPGSRHCLTATPGRRIVQERVGKQATVEGMAYGERRTINGVTVSLHPAGHMRGAAQVRLEQGGRVCVVTGDYKREPDPTCERFEPVSCDLLVTECTFIVGAIRRPCSGRFTGGGG